MVCHNNGLIILFLSSELFSSNLDISSSQPEAWNLHEPISGTRQILNYRPCWLYYIYIECSSVCVELMNLQGATVKLQ